MALATACPGARHKPPSHTGLTVFAGDVALHAHVNGFAFSGHAGEAVKPHENPFTGEVARRGGGHKAPFDARPEVVGKARSIGDFEKHRHGVGGSVASGGGRNA